MEKTLKKPSKKIWKGIPSWRSLLLTLKPGDYLHTPTYIVHKFIMTHFSSNKTGHSFTNTLITELFARSCEVLRRLSTKTFKKPPLRHRSAGFADHDGTGPHNWRTSFTNFPTCEVHDLRGSQTFRLRISFTEFPSTLITEFPKHGVANRTPKTFTEL